LFSKKKIFYLSNQCFSSKLNRAGTWVLTNLSETYRLKVIDFSQGGVAQGCTQRAARGTGRPAKKGKHKNIKKFVAQPIVKLKI